MHEKHFRILLVCALVAAFLVALPFGALMSSCSTMRPKTEKGMLAWDLYVTVARRGQDEVCEAKDKATLQAVREKAKERRQEVGLFYTLQFDCEAVAAWKKVRGL